MHSEGYRTKIAGRVSGLSSRQLDYYDRTGLVKPSVRPADGYGSRRKYSFTDIVELRTVKALREKVSLQKIRKAVAYLHTHFPDVEQPLAELRFLSDGETTFVLTSDPREMLDALRHGQVVISVALGRLIAEVREELEKTESTITERIEVRGLEYTIDYTPDLEEGGYVVTCRDLRGAVSQGETVDEAREMITDAITMILELLEEREWEKRARKAGR